MKNKKRADLPRLYPLICGKCGEAIFENGKPKPCPKGHAAAKHKAEGERG